MSEKSDWYPRKLTRREFLAAAGSLPLAAAAAARGQTASLAGQSGNILIIICDQLSQRVLGCYGDKLSVTPNIDLLARSGVRFSSAYTNCPLCQPSRASFWTGRYPHETRIDSNFTTKTGPLIPSAMTTLGSIFQKAKYDTVHFGKQHDAGALRGFSLIASKEADLDSPKAWPVDYDSKEDVNTTANVIRFLQESHDAPFLAVASLNNPHNICGWVGENEGPHENIPLPEGSLLPPLPDNFEIKDLKNRPLPIQYLCCSHRRLRQAAQWNELNYRHYLAAYYHYISLVDTQVGQIMDALVSIPEAKNTLVVLMADHGDGMSSHRMVTKQVSFYEEMTRIPLIFSGAGLAGHSQLIREPMVSLLDLMPTLCDYAGLQAPADLPGRSLLPWIRDENPSGWPPYVVSEWQTEWGYTVSPGRMLRTSNFKYVRYLEGSGEELYDLESDPGEKLNLAGLGQNRKDIEKLREMLKEHTRITRDPFFGLGVKVDPRWRSHKLGYANHEGPSAPEAAWEAEGRKENN